jgi:hypothetical protein
MCAASVVWVDRHNVSARKIIEPFALGFVKKVFAFKLWAKCGIRNPHIISAFPPILSFLGSIFSKIVELDIFLDFKGP